MFAREAGLPVRPTMHQTAESGIEDPGWKWPKAVRIADYAAHEEITVLSRRIPTAYADTSSDKSLDPMRRVLSRSKTADGSVLYFG